MANSENIIDEENEKWDLLECYICDICKEKFYFVKKDVEDKIKEDEFKDEPFTSLPIFLNEGVCPFCHASKKRLKYIPSQEEKRLKLEKEKQDKLAAKEKLKKELEKLKEEEKRLDKLHSVQLEKMINEIYDDTFDLLKDLELSLRNNAVTIDRFETLFIDGAFNIMQRDNDIYEKQNKEISLILSNSFKVGFREAILDFTDKVRKSLYVVEDSIKTKELEIEKASSEEEKEILSDEIKDMKKDGENTLKDDIKDAKDQKGGLGDDFLRNLRKELR